MPTTHCLFTYLSIGNSRVKLQDKRAMELRPTKIISSFFEIVNFGLEKKNFRHLRKIL